MRGNEGRNDEKQNTFADNAGWRRVLRVNEGGLMNRAEKSGNNGWLGSRRSLVLIAFLAIVGFLLFTEQRAHLFGILPYLLLLACPLMHMFMHGSHGKRDNDSGRHH
jgi:Protein of unknown function (DUF2933)